MGSNDAALEPMEWMAPKPTPYTNGLADIQPGGDPKRTVSGEKEK